MQNPHEFLDRLVGEWMLTGKMGDVALRQRVHARWVLGDQFLSMHCKSETAPDNPTAKYEAIYHFGHNQAEDLYVMHLLDTTGVPTACVLGLAERKGDRLPFVFDYGAEEFTNELRWHPDIETWTFHQTYLADGVWKTFANKEMKRIAQSL